MPYEDEEGHKTVHRPYLKGPYGNRIQDTPRTFSEETHSVEGSDFWELRPEDRERYTRRVKRAPGYVKYDAQGNERMRPYKGSTMFSPMKHIRKQKGAKEMYKKKKPLGFATRGFRKDKKFAKAREKAYWSARKEKKANAIKTSPPEIGKERQTRVIKEM
jgi:hypothetical protein